MDVIIPAVQDLLKASRAKNLPVVYTSTAYAVTDGPNSDMGLWHHKIPAELLQLGSEDCEIDDRIAPQVRRTKSSIRSARAPSTVPISPGFSGRWTSTP